LNQEITCDRRIVMRIWVRRGLPALLAALILTLLVAACGAPTPPSRSGSAPAAAVPAGLVATPVTVPAGYGAPFDTPRSVFVPPGWRMSVWARLLLRVKGTWMNVCYSPIRLLR
jgi:hypothetical protein